MLANKLLPVAVALTTMYIIAFFASNLSPARNLEEEYLSSLNFVERGYYRFLSDSDKRKKLAEFSAANPEIVRGILEKID